MQATISVEIPREISHAVRMNADELKRELAVHLFEQDKLSFGKAREMAGMSVWGFMQLLKERNIAIHYDREAYEQDVETSPSLNIYLKTPDFPYD